VVCAGAVLLHSSAKFSEHQDDHFLAGVVFFQVLVEVFDSIGNLSPQLGECSCLVGVGVKSTRVQSGIEHPRAKTCQMHLGHVLQPLGELVAAILHRGGVSRWRSC